MRLAIYLLSVFVSTGALAQQAPPALLSDTESIEAADASDPLTDFAQSIGEKQTEPKPVAPKPNLDMRPLSHPALAMAGAGASAIVGLLGIVCTRNMETAFLELDGVKDKGFDLPIAAGSSLIQLAVFGSLVMLGTKIFAGPNALSWQTAMAAGFGGISIAIAAMTVGGVVGFMHGFGRGSGFFSFGSAFEDAALFGQVAGAGGLLIGAVATAGAAQWSQHKKLAAFSE